MAVWASERSPFASICDELVEQLASGITKASVAINATNLFLFFMGTLPRATVNWVPSNELVLTSRMFVLPWTRPDLFCAYLRIYRCGTVSEFNRTSEP